MLRQKFVVDLHRPVEWGRHCRHYARPVHTFSSYCLLMDLNVFTLRAKRFKGDRKERLAHGDGPPSQKVFDGGPAAAALAWAHAAARLQLGVGPAGVAEQAAECDVFAAADDGVRVRERTQFSAEGECFLHALAEGSLGCCATLQGSAAAVWAGQSEDLALHEGRCETG